MTSSSLSPFFSPRGIAIIGASHDPTKLGYGLARNLVQSNFHGAVYFINPKGGYLLGKPVYTSLKQAPDPLDLAIVLIPAQFVPQALQECGARGIKAVIVNSGGFRETGEEGARLEAECLMIAQAYGMRMLGPNCIGLLNTHLPMDATFLPPPGPPPGDVAFISHSGAICAAVNDWARGRGFGLSWLVSLGNQADVCETDVLAPIAADPFTRVLTLYLEGVKDGRRFVAEASRLSRQKPIIALKVGRFVSGQKAVASHTGAMAGQENAFQAAFRRAGVIRADTSEELFDWARALAWCPPSKGRAVAILTNAGGPGATASDALEYNGMRLAELNDSTHQALRTLLPPAASLHNPVDMLASASPEQYAQSLLILLQDPNFDSVLVILRPPPMYTAGAVAKALIPVIHVSEKPVVVALMGERLIGEAIEHFRAAHVVEYRFPERAASALYVLAQRAEYLTRAEPTFPATPGFASKKVSQILHAFRANRSEIKGTGFLPPEVVRQLLKAYGITTPPEGLAFSDTEASRLASKIGFPVALKVVSKDIVHKSDVGGMLLNLTDQASVSSAYFQVINTAREANPEADIQGVLVQRMIPAGQEVIIGVVQDAQFGPLVMFGSGGVEVEGLKDVAFALAPMTEEEVDFLLDNTWAGRKLRGYRSLRAADRSATRQTLICLAQLAADFPELAEIEINPLRVLPEGQGVYALDARAKLR